MDHYAPSSGLQKQKKMKIFFQFCGHNGCCFSAAVTNLAKVKLVVSNLPRCYAVRIKPQRTDTAQA